MNRIALPSFGLSSIIPLILLLSATESFAQGNLIIMPRRVVLDASKRTQELSLANTGSDTAKYLISVIHYRMTENGSFDLITEADSGQYFADKNFRFFPRSVILAPNEAQTLKVQTINTSELKPGEYRSHLYFRAIPNRRPSGEKNTEAVAVLSIHLTPIFGVAIPVIIRKGLSTTAVTLHDPLLETNSAEVSQLKLSITRSGNMSIYGDIKINHISPQGKITQVGIVKGVAVYTPNTSRILKLNLDKNVNVDYHKGRLHILYTAPSDAKSVKFAEAELALF
jgi:hypothetical protein